jgi:hypothetical protein
VVSTITVEGIAARETPRPRLHRRGSGAANDWDKFDLCAFEVSQAEFSESRWAGFACTFTREEVLNGELITETAVANTAVANTAVQSGTPLTLDNLLSIDDIVAETLETEYLTPIDKFEFTGTFIPSGTSFSATTLTAYPKRPARDEGREGITTLPSKRFIERDEQIDGPETVTKTSTSYITVSRVDNSPSSTSSLRLPGSKSAASPITKPGTLFGTSLLVALAMVI